MFLDKCICCFANACVPIEAYYNFRGTFCTEDGGGSSSEISSQNKPENLTYFVQFCVGCIVYFKCRF
jgi:hypothetical protein